MSESLLSIQVDQADVNHLTDVLDPVEFRKAIYQATLRTTRKLAVQIKDGVQEVSAIRAKYLAAGKIDDGKHAISLIRPKGGIPEGGALIRDIPMPLEAFPHTATKTMGIAAVMMQSKGALRLKHGFEATMPSGYEGIFLREKLPVMTSQTTVADMRSVGFSQKTDAELQMILGGKQQIGRGMRPQKRVARGGDFPKVTPKGYAERLPIKEVMGPTVYKVVNIPAVLNKVVFNATEEFHRLCESQISRFLDGKPADSDPN